MNIRKSASYALAATLMMCASMSSAEEVDPIEWLEIGRVDFNLLTTVAIPCDTFMEGFTDELEKFPVYNKKEIKRFSRILDGLTPSTENFPPDTRAKVLIHYKDGVVGTLCLSFGRISWNERLMEPDRKMVDFVRTIRKSAK